MRISPNLAIFHQGSPNLARFDAIGYEYTDLYCMTGKNVTTMEGNLRETTFIKLIN